MVTIILAIALLVALTGLGIEIGVASWNIRRAGRYRRREAVAEHTAERAANERDELAGQMKALDEYASKISWLLNFLYKRYDKFTDLEREVNDGPKDVEGDTPIGDIDAQYKDLKKALKTIRVTVSAADRMGNLMDSIAAQVGQIMEDFREDDEEAEPEKPANEQDKESKFESAVKVSE